MTRPTPPPVPLEDRRFDVVLFGATGFTGKLVAEYLAAHADANGVRWAIAGRNKGKLEAVRTELGARDEALHDLSIRIADSHDVAALDELVPQARVVCTTVGPYARYGLDLARACARHGTSYCDLTGEPNFVRSVIDECHDVARGTRARIVNCAGYDSIPSDLGAHMAWDHAHRTHGEGLAWVKMFTGRTKGAASGGTVASALGLMDAAKKSKGVRRLLLDPHGLDPEPRSGDGASRVGDGFEADQRGVRFDEDLGRWTAPFVMASINTRIVRRSHALFREDGGGYGQRFHYNEAMSFRSGPRGLVTASLVTAGLGGFFAAAALPPARRLLERFVLPSPGQGPSREAIDSGFFEMHLVAQTESGRRLRGRVAGTKDPGYGETAKMLAETAMCLAKDGARLDPRFGVLTPASAMGMRLVERLRAAGMTFDVHDA
ncbi:MAG: saccharopine dehydrogenase NADP-binding domain-containing protein [Labilithrix sp.]|nr:saccharopine dehydrogenase NADP-binding domain-containing protein [Labilithrix sp.]